MVKERYLTTENLRSKSSAWMETLEPRKKWPTAPENPVLLILDMQRFFLDETSHAFVPSAGAIVSVISSIAGIFEENVVLTRHVEDPDAGNLMNIWWKDTIRGENGSIIPDMDGLGTVIEKRHYSAFVGTDLEALLKDWGADSVVITGVMTDLCCETTARDAFMRGFRVYFVADATATYTEDRHLASLRIISEGFGEVVTSEEMRSLL